MLALSAVRNPRATVEVASQDVRNDIKHKRELPRPLKRVVSVTTTGSWGHRNACAAARRGDTDHPFERAGH
eukprot:1953364-Pyramimonas_sp.AAC.2